MKISMKVTLDVDSETWAANANGPWPEDDKRSLNTAVRNDIVDTIRHHVTQIAQFEELGITVEVK